MSTKIKEMIEEIKAENALLEDSDERLLDPESVESRVREKFAETSEFMTKRQKEQVLRKNREVVRKEIALLQSLEKDITLDMANLFAYHKPSPKKFVNTERYRLTQEEIEAKRKTLSGNRGRIR